VRVLDQQQVDSRTCRDLGTRDAVMPLGFAVTDQMTADASAYGMFDALVHAGDIAYAGTSMCDAHAPLHNALLCACACVCHMH